MRTQISPNMRAEHDRLHLTYRVRTGGGEWEDEQAFGESLDPDKLERLGRYEVHLDRKLERTLAMLLRLKDLRQGTIAG